MWEVSSLGLNGIYLGGDNAFEATYMYTDNYIIVYNCTITFNPKHKALSTGMLPVPYLAALLLHPNEALKVFINITGKFFLKSPAGIKCFYV